MLQWSMANGEVKPHMQTQVFVMASTSVEERQFDSFSLLFFHSLMPLHPFFYFFKCHASFEVHRFKSIDKFLEFLTGRRGPLC